MRRRTGLLAAAILLAPLAACGGSGDDAGGTPVVNLFIASEAWLPDIVEACNAQAAGAYEVVAEALPTNPDAQREQLVRRLAAGDDAIDVIGMDVIWTGEFARAGWITPYADGELEFVGGEEQVFAAPFESAQFEGEQYGAPLNSNTRLLWYRRDLLGQEPVPQTWDELFDTAEGLGSSVQETGIRAESLIVQFNALVESAGSSIIEVDDEGVSSVVLEEGPTVRALEILSRFASTDVAPAGLTNADENVNRLAFEDFEGGSAFMINWPFVYSSAVEAGGGLVDQYGVAPYPRVDPDVPAAAPLGGFNLGIGAFTRDREAALAAVNCLTDPEQQRTISTVGGQPPVSRELAEDPAILDALPFLPLMTEQLETAAPRPVTPQYNDVSLAVREVLHPLQDIEDPQQTYQELRDLLEAALDSQAVL